MIENRGNWTEKLGGGKKSLRKRRKNERKVKEKK